VFPSSHVTGTFHAAACASPTRDAAPTCRP
jgi:hypothetical protein